MPNSSAPRIPVRDVHQRARRSLWLVLSRQFLIAGLTFGSGIVLARTLSPADFGLFAIATFIVVFLRMLTDLGLHSALVQQDEDPGQRELRTAFTVQQIAVTLAVLLLWPASEWLPIVYPKASGEIVWLVRLMSLELYFLSWCRPSEALIERTLRYDRLVPIDVAVTCMYCCVALVLALNGCGVWSFGFAYVSAGFTRLVLVLRAAPWTFRFALDRPIAFALLRIGSPLQIGRLVAEAQYWVAPTLVAATTGPAAAGLLLWAAGNGRKPLEMLEYFSRVSLPHFSRLQHDEQEVERTLLRYITVFVLICGLWLAVLAVAGEDLVSFVYTDRWLPAVPAMIVFAGVGLLVSVRTVATTALAGLGRMMLIARVSVAAAFVTILASVGLVLGLGFIGVPLGQLVGAAIVLPLLMAGLGAGVMRRVLVSASVIVLPMVAAISVGLAANAAAAGPTLGGLVTAGAMTAVYVATAWWAGPEWLRAAAREELESVRMSIRASGQS